MNPADNFQMQEGFAVFRPTGRVSLQQGVEMVTAAIEAAREQGIRKLMVVIPGISVFPSPSLGARYFFVQEWARAARGKVAVAMVAPAEMIDPQKFGVKVA